jgi:hypothetical protein
VRAGVDGATTRCPTPGLRGRTGKYVSTPARTSFADSGVRVVEAADGLVHRLERLLEIGAASAGCAERAERGCAEFRVAHASEFSTSR